MSGQTKIPTTEGLTAVSQIPRATNFNVPENAPILSRIIALVNNQPTQIRR
jgi:hypothetical protein